MADQKAVIEAKQEEKEVLLAELKEKQENMELDLSELEKTSKDLESTIQKLVAEREAEKRGRGKRQRKATSRAGRGTEEQENNSGSNNSSDNNNNNSGDTPSRGSSTSRMIWPAPSNSYVSSEFKPPHRPRHKGIDIAGPGIYGKNAVAALGGTVVKVANDVNGYGNYLVIDHGGGLTTLYAHGSKVLVSLGDRVSQGQAVMLIGDTGVSTGPHLHFK